MSEVEGIDFQLTDGTGEIQTSETCPICKGVKWKRFVDGSIIKEVCVCGYEKIVGRIHPRYEPPVTGSDHWDGVRDNIEKLVEKDFETGRR